MVLGSKADVVGRHTPRPFEDKWTKERADLAALFGREPVFESIAPKIDDVSGIIMLDTSLGNTGYRLGSKETMGAQYRDRIDSERFRYDRAGFVTNYYHDSERGLAGFKFLTRGSTK